MNKLGNSDDSGAGELLALARSVGLKGVRKSQTSATPKGCHPNQVASAPLRSMDGAAELVALARACGILPAAETRDQAAS